MSALGKRVEFYRDTEDQWRWRQVKNGRTISDSGQGYTKRAAAIHGLCIATGGNYESWELGKPISREVPRQVGVLRQWHPLPSRPTVPYQIGVPVHVVEH